ncbi:ABC transporter ATP-binding protein [Candidatus Poriferisocius sp.]|uniref:ABC transporter ATP-binding protein n=1 Tax=Candidatus Poriferisocius sp. TaxID=3101276 RepID=UPI003B58FFBE
MQENMSTELAIECEKLVFAFDGQEKPVLDGVSFLVFGGQSVAIMGPSGSGKTTLLHCIAGLLKPTLGRLSVAAVDLMVASPRAIAAFRRNKVAMVFQFGELLPELTVAENVLLPLYLRGERPGRDVVWRTLEAVGLNELEAWPAQLSGGEIQRVAIARALVTDPEVLLCDEPTGSLDEVNSESVIRLLREAVSRTGATMVTSTHDHLVAEQMDEVYELHNGRLEPGVLLGQA